MHFYKVVRRSLVVGFFTLSLLPLVQAGAVESGTPSQTTNDGSSASSGQAGWGDMPGGVTARPYVQSLTVINGDVSTPVVTNGTTTPQSVPDGKITTSISPLNLCRAGEPAQEGRCYTTPNRVGIAFGYSDRETVQTDFSNPSVPLNPTVNADTVFDMTLALNTLGKSLRWTWISGDLIYWQTTNLGQDDATVRIKFKPASAPFVTQFPEPNGCTATPINTCSIQTADAQTLTASMVLSLDETLNPALTGAAFATQNAIAGFLEPGGTAQAPTLGIQVASTHTKADGSPQLGVLKAFIPAAALLNLYGILPADATAAFTTTRTGDAGTNDPPSYTPWNAATDGSDGLLVTVQNITFSVPDYRVASKLKPITVSAKKHGAVTTIKSSVKSCTAKKRCIATVYSRGRGNNKLSTKATKVGSATLSTKSVLVAVSAKKLKKGDNYLLVVRSAKKKLLASVSGSVK